LVLDRLSVHNIGFVEIDVEGHELEALAGCSGLISKQRPTFLSEAEERHRPGAPKLVFDFAKRDYRGVFVYRKQALPVERFDPAMQDARNLRNDVARSSIVYPNNSFPKGVSKTKRRFDWNRSFRNQNQPRVGKTGHLLKPTQRCARPLTSTRV